MLTFTIKSNSRLFKSYQKEIVVELLNNYFRTNINNGNGSYLAVLDINNINFYWCDEFNNDNGLYGSWSPIFFNDVFLKPGSYDSEHVQYTLNKTKDKELNNCLTTYEFNQRTYNKPLVEIKNNNITFMPTIFENSGWIKDFEKWSFLKNLLCSDCDCLVNTICHELYHKWQCSASPLLPIFYIANLFASLFFGYTNASKLFFLIEGDVRKYVDNEKFSELVDKFTKAFQLLQQYAICYKYDTILLSLDYSSYIDAEQTNNFISFKNDFKNNDRYNQIYNSYEYKLIFNIVKKYDILNSDFIQYVEKNSF